MVEPDAVELKVFISYSWTSSEHEDWVLELAQRLVEDGIDVVIDKWSLTKGQDKYVFMERMVHDASICKVLMICDKAYAAKADERKGGVGDEALIITPKIYGSGEQKKFLPIITERDEQNKEYMPHFLKSRVYIDLSNPLKFEEEYIELKRAIVDLPRHVKPPLGRFSIASLGEEGQVIRATTSKFRTVRDAILHDRNYATGAAEDYLEALLSVIKSLGRIELASGTEASISDIEGQILGNIESFLPYRDDFIEFMIFISKYGSSNRLFEVVQRFFTTASALMFLEYGHNFAKVFNDVHQFLISELFLYTIAILMRYDRYQENNDLLGAAYSYSNTDYGLMSNYHVFAPYMENVDPWQRNRSRVGIRSSGNPATLQTLKLRANHKDITFHDVMNVDYALFIRSVLHPAESIARRVWIPITLTEAIYTNGYADRGFPLFRRAMMHNDFSKLCILLNVSGKVDLVSRFNAACDNGEIIKFDGGFGKEVDLHKRLTCLARLDTV